MTQRITRDRLVRAALFMAMGLALGGMSIVVAQLPVARITSIFPPGGKAGSSVEVTVAGNDLDDATRLWFSNPAITSITGAAELAPETIVNGRLTAGTPAWYQFSAKKGQRLFIECLSGTIDSRMDATLMLWDNTGRELALDRTTGLIDFTASSDGEYRLRVADFLHRGGDDYFYRLALTAGPQVDFIFPPAGLAGTTNSYTLYGRNQPDGKPATNFSIAGRPLEQ